MIATRPVQFLAELPGLKARRVNDQYSQIERARLRATKAYLQNPEAIGHLWVELWQSRSVQAASMVLDVMVHDIFRPHTEDRYRWFLARRKYTIFGLLTPRREEEWDEETHRVVAEFRAINKRTEANQVAVAEPKPDAEHTEQDPDDIIEGLNHQQKDRFKRRNQQ